MASPDAQIIYEDRLRVLIIASAADTDAGVTHGAMWRLAETLSPRHDVILAFPEHTGAQHADFAVIYYNQRNIAMLAKDSDLVIMADVVRQSYPGLGDLGASITTTAGRLRQGDLLEAFQGKKRVRDGSATNSGILDDAAAEPLLLLRPDQAVIGTGFGHRWRQLKLHMHQGGVKRVASRGGALIKRKFSSNR